MKRYTRMKVLWLGAVALLVTSCARYNDLPYTLPKAKYDTLSDQQKLHYRESVRECMGPGKDSPSPGMCHLAIIEFDDFGDFWWPGQLEDTMNVIDRLSHPPTDGLGNGEAIVVVFVHGWKHDASPEDEQKGNLGDFKNLLIRVALEERSNRGEIARPVVGVYLAWSGLTAKPLLPKQLSFFGRKNAAERVAGVSFSHAIHRIVGHAKDRGSARYGNPNSVVIVMGHSFGGLILEDTLLPTLAIETDGFMEFNPDLVILINSANEAIRARQFIQALEKAPPRVAKVSGSCVSQPLIVSVTSAGDWGTGTVFPIGMRFKGPFKRLRPDLSSVPGVGGTKYDQWSYYTHTPGDSIFSGTLHSHAFDCPFSPSKGCRLAGSRKSATGEIEFELPVVKLGECRRESERRRGGLKCIDSIYFKGPRTRQVYSIDRRPGSGNNTAYWIMQTPASVMPNHTGIFQDELGALLYAFVHLKNAAVVSSQEEARRVIGNYALTIQDQLRPNACTREEIWGDSRSSTSSLTLSAGEK